MLVAYEALFFDGCDQFAVDVQGGGRIMTEGAGKAENRQCHRKASGTGDSARLSRNIGTRSRYAITDKERNYTDTAAEEVHDKARNLAQATNGTRVQQRSESWQTLFKQAMKRRVGRPVSQESCTIL